MSRYKEKLKNAAERGDVNFLESQGKRLDKYAAFVAKHAILAGTIEIVRFLVERHFLRPKKKDAALAFALQNDQRDIAAYLLKNKAILPKSRSAKLHSMHCAAIKGYVYAVEHLHIKKGVSLKISTQAGYQPVHAAASYNHVNVIKYLYRHGVSLDTASQSGNQPIHYAVVKGHVDVIHYLLEQGVSSHTQTGDGFHPIHLAAQYGRVNVIAYLLHSRSVSLDVLTRKGNQPIHLAAWNGHVNVIDYLCVQGVSLTVSDSQGNQPVHLAALEGHVNVIVSLLKNGAPLNVLNRQGRHPIHLAATGGHVNVIKYLHAHGVSLTMPNQNGNQPIHCAALYGCVNVIDYLRVQGVSLTVLNPRGNQPIHLAVLKGHVDVIKYLLAHSIPLSNDLKVSLLEAAIEKEKLNSVRCIIECIYEAGGDDDVAPYSQFNAQNFAIGEYLKEKQQQQGFIKALCDGILEKVNLLFHRENDNFIKYSVKAALRKAFNTSLLPPLMHLLPNDRETVRRSTMVAIQRCIPDNNQSLGFNLDRNIVSALGQVHIELKRRNIKSFPGAGNVLNPQEQYGQDRNKDFRQRHRQRQRQRQIDAFNRRDNNGPPIS